MTEEAKKTPGTLEITITTILAGYGLNKYQVDVALLFLQGKKAAEIAAVQNLSVANVHHHLKGAEEKLHTPRRGFAWLVFSQILPPKRTG